MKLHPFVHSAIASSLVLLCNTDGIMFADALNQRLVGNRGLATSANLRPQQTCQQHQQQPQQQSRSQSQLHYPQPLPNNFSPKHQSSQHAATAQPKILLAPEDLETATLDADIENHGLVVATPSVPFLRRIRRVVTNATKIDRAKMAKLGTTFALSYNYVSNFNGAITFTLSWFIACSRTGLSPFAPGQWKTLLSAYAGLYAIVTVLRPVRIGVAVALCPRVERCLNNVQHRLGCSRGKAIGLMFAIGIVAWVAMGTSGVFLASALTGVPVFA